MTKFAYYKSKWKYDDLHEKTVEFVLTDPICGASGRGKFRIHVYADLICIEIFKNGMNYQIFNPFLADKIERHPDPSVADFRLIA
jgi:hypothetical protein